MNVLKKINKIKFNKEQLITWREYWAALLLIREIIKTVSRNIFWQNLDNCLFVFFFFLHSNRNYTVFFSFFLANFLWAIKAHPVCTLTRCFLFLDQSPCSDNLPWCIVTFSLVCFLPSSSKSEQGCGQKCLLEHDNQ